jgi:predicted nucleotide-binding protein
MVVHGRNLGARDAIFTFLRSLGLIPIEWEQAVAETGVASPHNFDAVRAAMDIAQAVVVVLTAEDRAGVIPELAGEDTDDIELRGQPRQNVILEAGLAMGVDRARTILVELGPIRRASDFEGLNAVRLTNNPAARGALRSRLITAGCSVEDSATDWTLPGAGGDFEAPVIQVPTESS